MAHEVSIPTGTTIKECSERSANLCMFYSQMLGECIGLSSHGKWKNLRAVANPTFTHVATKGYISVVQERVQRWFEDLDLGEKRDLDPAGDVKFLPFVGVHLGLSMLQ